MSDQPIRLLIADDSAFIRRYLTELFHEESDIAIVGVACDGDQVVELAATLHPDVITMDYNMPKRNGLDAAAAIMRDARPLPGIIMLSGFEGEEGKEVRHTLEACGAHVVAKPSGEVSLDIETVARDIVARVREVGAVTRILRSEEAVRDPSLSAPSVYSSALLSTRESLRVVVIGASTGGPPVVEHLLSMLDPASGVAVVIVQHMSKYFTELFAERLDRVTGFSVAEAKSGDLLLPGHALVVPGGMSLSCSRASVDHSSSGNSFLVLPCDVYHEEAIDKTMASVAHCFGARSIGVLLSGMGDDGVEGMRAIKDAGGITIAQEPSTATIASMPMSAIAGGFVDQIMPADAIPHYISFTIAKTE